MHNIHVVLNFGQRVCMCENQNIISNNQIIKTCWSSGEAVHINTTKMFVVRLNFKLLFYRLKTEFFECSLFYNTKMSIIVLKECFKTEFFFFKNPRNLTEKWESCR